MLITKAKMDFMKLKTTYTDMKIKVFSYKTLK